MMSVMEERKMMLMAAETSRRMRFYLWTESPSKKNSQSSDAEWRLWELQELAPSQLLLPEHESSRLGPDSRKRQGLNRESLSSAVVLEVNPDGTLENAWPGTVTIEE